MRVSFIVGLYNCLPLTREMLASLQLSLPKGLEYEIIFVDDFSTDETRFWLKTLKAPRRYILNDKNLGYAATNNRGAKEATGDVLIFLNNDLIFCKGWLEPLIKAHKELGNKAGVIGNVQRDAKSGEIDHAGVYINAKGKPTHIKTLSFLSRLYKPVLIDTLSTGACFLISKELWLILGGFDEKYINGSEDIDLQLRVRALGRINAVCLGSTIRHHISQSPGRKSKDEENSFRLTLTWKDTLAELSLDDWCRHHFETYLPEPRDFPDQSLARKIALYYILRFPIDPPKEALPNVYKALEYELTRWRVMFKP